jgi:hypothetical protein
MNCLVALYMVALFVLFTPGIFFTLDQISSKKVGVAATHGVLFVLVWLLTHKMVRGLTELGPTPAGARNYALA